MAPGGSDNLNLAGQIAAGTLDDAAIKWITKGFSAWVCGGGAIPLERCLHLPKTERKVRLAERNYWLAKAAMETNSPSPWAAAVRVQDELGTFISRGPWRVWSGLDKPPAGASELRTALFHVAKINRGRPLTARQISRCIGHICKG